jgi:hypothetical protein
MTTFCTDRRDFRSVLCDERGISMTESVIVIPFFLIVWMGLIFLHHTYLGRLEAQVEAHNKAFQGAMQGKCEGAKEGAVHDDRIDDAINDKEAGDEAVSLNAMDLATAGGGDSMFDWSNYVVSAEVEVKGLPKPLGGPTKKMKGEARLMCNMEPRDGLSDALFEFLKGLLD